MKKLRDILEKRIYPDVMPTKQFGDDTKMKLLGMGIKPPEQNPNIPVDTTGANSPFADKSVKSYIVTPEKPLVGKDDAIKKALAAKGYDETGKKINVAATREFPDNPPQKQFGQDTKMKLIKLNKTISSDIEKMKEPVKKQIKPKVGSLVVKQTGYPAAKEQVAPIPKARPTNLVPKEPKSFKQAFAAAPEGSTFTYKGKKYLRKTKR